MLPKGQDSGFGSRGEATFGSKITPNHHELEAGTPGTPDVPFEPSGGVMGPPDDPNESLAPLYHSRKNPEMASLSPLTVRKVQ